MRPLSDVDGLTAADLMHRRLTTTPAATTVGELREYFAASSSRKLALVVDGERYVGSIAASALPAAADPGEPVAAYATPAPTVRPHHPAVSARDLAIEQPSQRLPVVDDGGALVGIVAIASQGRGFCGT
jgi:CBS domain-containing protein